MPKRNRLADILFPERLVCALCNEESVVGSDGLCDRCRAALAPCPRALAAPAGLDGLAAGLIYNAAIEPAIHRFKYERQVWLAPYLAQFLVLPDDWQIDCMVPVPLHPLRSWLRTFNQSELLAESLTERYPVPIRRDLLRRTRYTLPQAKLDAAGRAENLVGAFSASLRASGLNCLLVDDVTTTHHTLQECAGALKQVGAARVYAACVCLAGRDGRGVRA